MNEITIMYICVFIMLSFIFAIQIGSQYDEENGVPNKPNKEQKYRPYFYSMQLPICLVILLVVDFCFHGPRHAVHTFFSGCFSVFLSLAVCFMILLCLLPLLRKHISARSCAFLWLVPNYLYIVVLHFSQWDKPLLILHAPGNSIWWILGIWFLGFAFVLIWKFVSHLHYRKYILQDAIPVTDSELIKHWQKEIEATRLKDAPKDIFVSPKVSTPMTIGLLKENLKVVLPKKTYSAEDLALIFRHELVHIGREDYRSKFFLVFCTAMCWFNPLMWIASKKCSEDLELSCDETVLLYADQFKRQRYAELILKTAGDERGFTTCLSVKAKSLHYRLKNILNTKERASGVILIGVVSFLLMSTCGHVALAYGDTTGQELIFANEDMNRIKLTEPAACTNEEELLHYLEQLPVSEITGDYYFSELEYKLHLTLNTPTRKISLNFSDEVLHMSVVEMLNGVDFKEYTYYLPDGVDWNVLNSYL